VIQLGTSKCVGDPPRLADRIGSAIPLAQVEAILHQRPILGRHGLCL